MSLRGRKREVSRRESAKQIASKRPLDWCRRTTRKDARIGVPRDRVDLADVSAEPPDDVS